MRARLVVFFPLGDPAIGPDFVELYAEEGVDIVECGWPARQLYLDGPDVRAAMARAQAPAAAWDAVRERLAGRGGPKPLLMTDVEGGHPGLADPHFFVDAFGVLAVAPPGDAGRAALEAQARAAGAASAPFSRCP